MENVVAPKRSKGKGKNPASGGAPKKKIAKPKANPFRRSDTGKLQLKGLQMAKRIETQTPKVSLMRERLELAESRLGSVSTKLKLVQAELASRAAAKALLEDKAADESDSSSYMSEVSLDSEIEDVEDEAVMAGQATGTD
jgi:hypothetical protein